MATIRDKYVLDVDTKGATSSINKIKGALGALAGALAIREFAQFTGSIIEATTQFERYQTVLQTFLGSQSKANAELTRLKDLANSLPQDLADITEAFVIFTRYGLDTSSQGIKAFSNIATASGKSLEQLAEALGDALTGEFERLKEFGIKVSKENGKIVARIGDDIVATADTAKELTTQLQDLGNTRFGGAAEANADTLSQSMSNLRGAVFEAQVAFGEGLKPALKEIADELANFLRVNEELSRSLGAGVGEALRTLAAGARLLIENMDLVRNAIIAVVSIKAAFYFKQVATELRTAAIGARSASGVFTNVAKALRGMARSLPGVGLLRAAFAALSGPVGIAVAGVTALGLGIKALAPVTLEVNGLTTTFGEVTSAVFWKAKKVVGEYASTIKDKLYDALSGLRQRMANITQPFIESMNRMMEAAKKAINVMIGLFVGLFQQITTGIGDIPRMFLAAMNASLGIIGNFVGRAGNQIAELWNYITTLGEDAIENSFEGITADISKELEGISNATSIDWDNILNTDYVGKAVEQISNPLRVLVEEYREHNEALANSTKQYDDHILRIQRMREEQEKLAQQQRKITDAVKEEQAARQKATSDFQASLDKFKQEYEFRTSLIGLTDEQKELEQQRYDLQQKLASAILPIQERILKLEKANTEEAKARIEVLKGSISDIKDVYETELMYLDQMVEARNEELRIKRESESIDAARLSAAEAIAEAEERIRYAKENAELAGLSGLKKQLKEIELEEKRIARAAKERVKAQLETGVNASVIKAELAQIDASVAESIRKRQELAKVEYDNRRAFSTGWKKAFEEYAEDASNAASQAQRLFEKATSGMEDAIVGFAKTGKFEFKSFVNSILEELLRSQIRQLIAKTFGGLGLGGGGTGGGGGLFGGFFATGGMIPPGRFGVVGENGPELVSGPANVTPNVGNTAVTYNINAVDALSFKQMVASDPEFLFAVTQQGSRSIPTSRR